jgi:hypothetical protein
VNCWNNCCGFCGPLNGNPQVFSGFSPQPKDAQAFVDVAQSVMLPDDGPGNSECTASI